MGNWGGGPGYSGGFEDLTSEQRTKLNDLDRDYHKETKDLRNKIWDKSMEIDSLLNAANPDLDKVRAFQKEISALRTDLDQKELDYEIEARKVVPEKRYSGSYGRGPGRHMGGYGGGRYGHHMGAYGGWQGRHMGGYRRGYGPGSCWN